MKRCVSLLIFAVVLGSLSSLLLFMQAQAQIDEFTYFIPFPADQLDNLFDVANNDNNFINNNIITTLSISIRRTGTVIYYDHWEDNPEINLTSPTQDSTLIWGDNEPANGIPPGFTEDLLNAGDIITLRSTVELPRDSGQIFFDGGDELTAVGGNLAVSLAVWPESVGTLFAGAWELLTVGSWGTNYIIPVGVDLAGTGPGLREGFGVVALNVQAVEDGTEVKLDLDADGTFERTEFLDQGEQFTQISGDAQSGAEVEASAPVQVHLFTGNPSPGVNYEARAYLMLPTELWTGDYLAPRSSDGDFWLYNPDTTPLTITAVTSTTVTTLTIPAKSTLQYPNGALSSDTATRFTAIDGRLFSGVAALDQDLAQDWGYVVLPVEFLTPQVLIGWAPGNETPAGNIACNPPTTGFESPVYVTALTTTTLTVDYDLSDDDVITKPLTPLNEISIFDENDCDMTGALLYTTDGTPFVATWGQDQTAPEAEPSIDVGTGQVPLATLSLKKTITLLVDADGSGTITWGDTVRFGILATNNTNLLLKPATLTDTLPATVDYITSTSTVKDAPIPDDAPPKTAFPFDEEGYKIEEGLGPQETIRATFDAIVKEDVDQIENEACIDSPTVPVGDCGSVQVPVQVPRLEMSKQRLAPVDGLAEAGDVITFGVTLTSTGNISITKLPLRDTYDDNHLTYAEAAPFLPDLVTPGTLTWTDLATATRFGPLPPGRTIALTLTFTVDDLSPNITQTINIALVEGAEGSDGTILPPLTDNAPLFFPPPPTPTPPPVDDDDDDGDDDDDEPTRPPATPVPPPAAPSLPVSSPSPPPDSDLPVTELPETGIYQPAIYWPMLGLLLTLVSLSIVGWQYLKRRSG